MLDELMEELVFGQRRVSYFINQFLMQISERIILRVHETRTHSQRIIMQTRKLRNYTLM